MLGYIIAIVAGVVLFGPKKATPPPRNWPAHGWGEPPAGSSFVQSETGPAKGGLQWRAHIYKLPEPMTAEQLGLQSTGGAELAELWAELQRSDGAYVILAFNTAEDFSKTVDIFVEAPRL
jgi:hypothetical protein